MYEPEASATVLVKVVADASGSLLARSPHVSSPHAGAALRRRPGAPGVASTVGSGAAHLRLGSRGDRAGGVGATARLDRAVRQGPGLRGCGPAGAAAALPA